MTECAPQTFECERGWHHLPLISDVSDEDSHDDRAITKSGGDDFSFNALMRNDSEIRHFWGGEMKGASAIQAKTRAAHWI